MRANGSFVFGASTESCETKRQETMQYGTNERFVEGSSQYIVGEAGGNKVLGVLKK